MNSTGSSAPDASSKPDTVAAWVCVADDGETLPEAIRRLARKTGGRIVDTVEDACAGSGNRPVMLVRSAPAFRIAARLAAGDPLDTVLDDWTRQAESDLARLRPIRRLALILDPAALAARPDTVRDALLRRLNLDMSDLPSNLHVDAVSPPDPVLLGLAHLGLDAAEKTRDLRDELDAMTPGSAAQPSLADLARAGAALQSDRASLARITTERDLLREELTRLSNDLRNIHADDTPSRTARLREDALGRRILQLGHRLAAQNDELARIKRSRSWRYTRPLRH